jgi:hypothetical protein
MICSICKVEIPDKALRMNFYDESACLQCVEYLGVEKTKDKIYTIWRKKMSKINLGILLKTP